MATRSAHAAERPPSFGSKYLKNSTFSGALVATLALVLGMAFVTPAETASAHTPQVTATCSTLTVDLANYKASVPSKDAVYHDWDETITDSPAVPATYVQEWLYVQKEHDSQTQWHQEGWNGIVHGVDHGRGWHYVIPQQHRDTTTVLTPALPAVVRSVHHHDLVTAATLAKTNTVKVTVDGTVVEDTMFETTFSKVYSFSNNYSAHTYRVQVTAWDSSQYNLDKSGTSTPCEKPPLQKNATGSIDVGSPTCTADGAVTAYHAQYATHGEPTYANGVASVMFTAETGHVFADGTATYLATTAYQTKVPQQSTDPEGLCYMPPPPKCVKNPTWGYTYSIDGSGTITAGGGQPGDALCAPLSVRPTTWSYDLPAHGNPSWAQTLIGYNDTIVDKIGTVAYAAPTASACYQNDIYASFEGFDALNLPKHLLGSHNPSEPAFLYETLSGKGPRPTYYSSSSEGCNTIVVPSNPNASIVTTCGAADITLTNAISLAAHTQGSSYTARIEKDGVSEEVVVAPNETKVVHYAFTEDSGDHTVNVIVDETIATAVIKTDCQINVATPVAPVIEQPTCATDGTITVPEQPAGVTFTKVDNVVTFAPASGYSFPEGTKASYTLDKAPTFVECNTPPAPKSVTTHQYAVTCDFVLTDMATTTVTPSVPSKDGSVYLDGTPVATSATTTNKVTAAYLTAHKIAQPAPCMVAPISLAFTGANTGGLAFLAALLLFAGCVLTAGVFFVRRRRTIRTVE